MLAKVQCPEASLVEVTFVVISAQTGVAEVPVFLNRLNTNVFSSKGPVYSSVAVGASVAVPPVNPLFVNEIEALLNIAVSEPSICVLGNEPFEPFSVDESRPTRNVLSASVIVEASVNGIG